MQGKVERAGHGQGGLSKQNDRLYVQNEDTTLRCRRGLAATSFETAGASAGDIVRVSAQGVVSLAGVGAEARGRVAHSWMGAASEAT
jgi:hypothetical protein